MGGMGGASVGYTRCAMHWVDSCSLRGVARVRPALYTLKSSWPGVITTHGIITTLHLAPVVYPDRCGKHIGILGHHRRDRHCTIEFTVT